MAIGRLGYSTANFASLNILKFQLPTSMMIEMITHRHKLPRSGRFFWYTRPILQGGIGSSDCESTATVGACIPSLLSLFLHDFTKPLFTAHDEGINLLLFHRPNRQRSGLNQDCGTFHFQLPVAFPPKRCEISIKLKIHTRKSALIAQNTTQ